MNIQKMKKNKALVSMLILVLMVLSTLLPNFSFAESKTQTVTIRKVAYTAPESGKSKGFDDFQTNGKNFDILNDAKYSNKVKAYTKKDYQDKYGNVTFAMYKLTPAGEEKFKNNNSELMTSLNDNGANSKFLDKTTKKEKSLNENGDAIFDLGVLSTDAINAYAILEIDPAKDGQLIAKKSSPMVLSLPHFNDDGTANFDLHLIAKNGVQDQKMKFNIIDEDNKKIKNAKFDLYKIDTPNQAADLTSLTAVKENIIATDGTMELTGLNKGRYYLVQKSSDHVRNPFDSADTTNKRYLVNNQMLKDNNNKYFFDLTNSGISINGSNIQKASDVYTIKNFSTAVASKKVKDDTNMEPGGVVEFEVNVLVPGDVDKYTKFSVKDKRSVDTLEKPVLKTTNNVTINMTDNGNGESEFTFPTLSQLENYKGKIFTFTYTMKIKEGLTSESKIYNSIGTVTRPNGVKNDVEVDVEKPIVNPINPKDPVIPSKPGNPDEVADPKVPAEPGNEDPTKDTGKVEIQLSKLTVKAFKKGLSQFGKESLPGVKFTVKRMKNGQKEYYNYNKATKVGKWITDEAQATIFETDASGQYIIDGIKKGDYNLEIKEVPETATMPVDKELTVKVDAKNVEKEIVVPIKAVLPLTGSEQLVVLAIMGIAIIATAVAVLRKKENK